MTRVAVIGAGLSALAFAGELGDAAQIRMFEKSRGYGGRMATRRHQGFQFDHGAQFFTAKSESFRSFLQPFVDKGVVACWDARFVEFEGDRVTARRRWSGEYPHYVAVPGMNALARALGESLDVELNTRVSNIRSAGEDWQLQDDAGRDLGRFDWVVCTVPATQAVALLPAEFAHLEVVYSRGMPGCYALMLGFTEALALDWDAALVKESAISWISVDNSKPGRPAGSSLLVQASNLWAEANMELDDRAVIAQLVAETSRVIGQDVSQADHVGLHRWRYANPAQRRGTQSLVDAGHRLAACGDWCVHGRVESAFLSGLDAARRIRNLL